MTLAGLLSGSGGTFEAPRSLYIHVPFCSSRCSYCDFHSFPCARVPPLMRASYVEKLLERTKILCEAASAPVETIYVGGGTPTVLEDEVFGRLLGGLGDMFGSSVREWTVEANPESLTSAKLELLVSHGVTRLSMGIQSMDEGELEILGRRAKVADNRRAVALASQSGLALSADLITAIPTASDGAFYARSTLSDSVKLLLENGFGHVSIYDLVVEEGTTIKKRLETGEILPADEDRAFDERKEAEQLLSRLGYARYEVSNYAKSGRECLHNAAYWSMNSYLGIGSGAVSTFASGSRSLRVEEGRDLFAYLEDPDREMKLSRIGSGDSAFEMIMMALRTSAGLDEARFLSRFGLDVRDLLAGTIKKWGEHFSEGQGRLNVDGYGLDILNRILVDALEEMDLSFIEDSVKVLR